MHEAVEERSPSVAGVDENSTAIRKLDEGRESVPNVVETNSHLAGAVALECSWRGLKPRRAHRSTTRSDHDKSRQA
jgi:hypothetical protein